MSELMESTTAADEYRLHIGHRYEEERNRRIRADGLRQYVSVEGKFSSFADDPWAGEPEAREPSTELVDVVVVGAGIAGLLTAVELRRAGVDDFRIIDKAADVGGTWYWNRYPGIACDCESLIYLPLLEDLGYVPTQKYARGAEISEHLRAVATTFSLYDNSLLQTQITDIRWSDQNGRWTVSTDRGDALRARYVVLGSGPLHRPKLPAVPGIEDFQGRQWHSSRWDYDFTGGDQTGGLVNLRDKRVAVIGTGATGVQIVPNVAPYAEHLYVVQRTPSAVDYRANAPISPEWVAAEEPGWQRRRMQNFDAILAGIPQENNLVADQWSSIWGGVADAMASGSLENAMAALAETDFQQMERIRARVDAEVNDPETAAALKPYYSRFCKRPTFSDEYLTAFNRPNVTLIDTEGGGLDRITETGIVFDGNEYPVDVIVHATGFEFGVPSSRTGGFEVYGPGGKTLSAHREDGVRSLHGIMSRGFPNLFTVGGLHQAAVSVNIPLVFGDQAHHVAQLVKELRSRGVSTFEVSEKAERQWGETIAAKSTYNEQASRSCTPGFYNNENTYEKRQPSVFATAYGGGPLEYAQLLEEWRAGCVDEDLELDSAATDELEVRKPQ
jgi:cation diffusion facilitator CzcD-associated flavoprotein CzcO